MLSSLLPQRIRDYFGPDKLGGEYIGVAAAFILMVGAIIQEQFLNGSFLMQFSPWAVKQLEFEDWMALCITGFISCFFFGISWAIGYVLALIISCVALMKNRSVKLLAFLVNNVIEFVYIIPIILTIAIIYTPLIVKASHNEISQGWAIAVPLLAGVFVLSGYQIYAACYQAAVFPDDRARALIDALYIPQTPRYLPHRIRSIYYTIIRRIDFDVRSYRNALGLALHLSFVAVVIVEMSIPNLYWNLSNMGLYWNLSSIVEDHRGLQAGIGYRVLDLRNSYQLERIAGIIWGLAMFAGVAGLLLRSLLKRRFDQHYIAGAT